MRFELVDEIVSQGPDRIETAKVVSIAEEYLADHFPGFPVLPGVLMVEVMVQSARKLLDPRKGHWVLAEVRNVRYGNMVRPGQRLCVSVERTPAAGSWGDRQSFKGVGKVGEEVAVQGKFVMRPMKG